MRKLTPNGVPARLVLSVLESAGILYAPLSPVIVSGLVQSGAFTGQTAGWIFALNMYGTAIGGFAVLFLLRRLRWRPVASGLLALLIALDLLSAAVADPQILAGLRFVHGLSGGALIGVSMSVIARMVNPERTVALFIMLQLVVGGVLTLLLVPLLPAHGSSMVWLSLAGFSVLALVLLPLLDDYEVDASTPEVAHGSRAGWLLIVPAMLALFVYQAGEMSAWTYVIEIGTGHGLEPGFISTAVAASLWIGGPAALFVTWWSTRSGRWRPLALSTLAMALSVALLLVPEAAAYMLANVGFGIFFSVSFPYLMGVASELDSSGQMGAVAGFSGNLGLATGPALAALLISDGVYETVVLFGVPAIVFSLLLAAAPARRLDRMNRTGRVLW